MASMKQSIRSRILCDGPSMTFFIFLMFGLNNSFFPASSAWEWLYGQYDRSRILSDGPSMTFFHFLDVWKN